MENTKQKKNKAIKKKENWNTRFYLKGEASSVGKTHCSLVHSQITLTAHNLCEGKVL